MKKHNFVLLLIVMMIPRHILLVEDDPDIRENTAEVLRLANYEVTTAENGRMGVEKAISIVPDLIICDIMMPELDGYGLLKIVSKNELTAGIPFIFLTAKADRNDIRKGMNSGADDYVTKPFTEVELLDAIESRLRHHEALQRRFKDTAEASNEFQSNPMDLKNLEKLYENRKTKVFRKDEEIYRQGDYANYLYFIMNGKVKNVKIDSYGKTIVNDIHYSNSYIGYITLLDDGEYHETAIAMENSELAVIPKTDFVDLINSNREGAIRFIKLLAMDVREREKRLLQLAYAPVRERVANALLMLNEKNTAPGAGTFSISRFDLACIVGTSKESLIRTLSEIKKEGLIRTDGVMIEIMDANGLKRISCI